MDPLPLQFGHLIFPDCSQVEQPRPLHFAQSISPLPLHDGQVITHPSPYLVYSVREISFLPLRFELAL